MSPPPSLPGLAAFVVSQFIGASPGHPPSAPPLGTAQRPQVTVVTDRFSRSSGVTLPAIELNPAAVFLGTNGDSNLADAATYIAAEAAAEKEQTETSDQESSTEGDGEEGIVSSLFSYRRVAATGGAFEATA